LRHRDLVWQPIDFSPGREAVLLIR
jgi:hypothetical protein